MGNALFRHDLSAQLRNAQLLTADPRMRKQPKQTGGSSAPSRSTARTSIFRPAGGSLVAACGLYQLQKAYYLPIINLAEIIEVRANQPERTRRLQADHVVDARSVFVEHTGCRRRGDGGCEVLLWIGNEPFDALGGAEIGGATAMHLAVTGRRRIDRHVAHRVDLMTLVFGVIGYFGQGVTCGVGPDSRKHDPAEPPCR